MGKLGLQYEHLSDSQIEHYGEEITGAGPEEAESIEAHLADCSACRSRLLAFHRSRFSPASMTDSSLTAAQGPDCYRDDELSNLAAGLLSPAVAAHITQHAEQCDHCGPILRAYTEDFSDDLSPEDQTLLNRLNSASPSWQKKMAARMAETASGQIPTGGSIQKDVAQPPSAVHIKVPLKNEGGQRTPSAPRRYLVGLPSLKWIFVPAGAIACALIVFFIWNAQRTTPAKVEKLVAQAYTENRIMEMRLPSAAWGPVRTTRGSGAFSTPLPLLEAANSLQQQSQKTLGRADWLNARAQAEILSGNPSQQLIRDLRIGIQQHPDAVPLLFDLAAANFRIGEITSNRDNYLQSKLALDKILKRFPSNSTALFNRALVEERLGMRDATIADLTACLASERDPAWADEARHRLERLKELR